ncbi:ATP-binding protein [Sphingobacterium sp. DN00404]|uniref:ATP-binding protein n=1 Tax=Sphingobacterium micropteri TaxID=2763501 RepID=A0ABR7YKS6_9SPHI|nr:ATP-binding protein [Sphingobacterium micropteri]MBD1431841.1 ATP-binding protein [Sphingobacterium micropteri]
MVSPHSIPRPIYLDRVAPFIGKNLIKVFIGQRRVGKSYLLFQLIEQITRQDADAKIIYINKEDLRFAGIKNADDLNNYVLQNKSHQHKTYVFIDEIQDIENFEAALRSLLLDEALDLYCTGSNANLLSGDVAGQLSGRSIEINVYSLSYEEFLVFHQLEDNNESLDKYLKYGGLPYLKHLPLEDDVIFEYLKNIYSTIVFRDVINRYAVRNTVFLEQLVFFLASNIGSIFSAKKISDFLKSQKVNIAANQVQLYIQHLTNAFLIHQVKRYDIEGKRLFEIGEKYYFENLGIRNALWGYRPEDRGKILENAVYNYLLIRGYTVEVGVLGNNEIDFIAEKKGEKMYIQVALSLYEEKTIEREFGNLQKIKDNYPKIVVTMDAFSGNSIEGIVAMDLRSFLTHSW